jgi:hypothetical protein
MEFRQTVTAIGKNLSKLEEIVVCNGAGHLRLKAALESQTRFCTQRNTTDESVGMFGNVVHSQPTFSFGCSTTANGDQSRKPTIGRSI